MRHICFWQHQLLQRGWWELKRLIIESTFNVTRLVIWARNYSCLDCLMVYRMTWTCRTHRKVTAEHSKRWDDFSGFQLHRRNCQTFCRIQKKVTDKLPNRWNSLSNFPLYWKVCQILWAYRLKMDAPTLQKNFDDCTGSKMALSILELWKLLILHFLFT